MESVKDMIVRNKSIDSDMILNTFRGRAFAHGAVGRRIDPSWGGPIELFLVPASAPRLV